MSIKFHPLSSESDGQKSSLAPCYPCAVISTVLNLVEIVQQVEKSPGKVG